MLWLALILPALAQDLRIVGTCPGTVDVIGSNLFPGGRVAVLTGGDVGNDVIPGGPCAGFQTELRGLNRRARVTADANGEWMASPTLGSGACGSPVQLLDVTTCSLTNLDFVPDVAPVPLSYALDIEPILQPACGGCHGLSGGFTLNHPELLAPSIDVPNMPRVTPAMPANSYLWHKINGTHLQVGGAGSQMPLGVPLPPGDLRLIEQWILDGALP